MQRKLVALVHCQLAEPVGRARALRAARSLGNCLAYWLLIVLNIIHIPDVLLFFSPIEYYLLSKFLLGMSVRGQVKEL